MVVTITPPDEVSAGDGAVDELRCTVGLEQQPLRHVAHGRRRGTRVAPHGEEELVLCRREALPMRLPLAPLQEPP
jgi:hypothetical protein